MSLAAYDNTPDVRIRFHYDDLGNWGYGLAIDDITVDLRPDHDISLDDGVTYLDTFQTPVYTQIPLRQAGTITFDGRVTNFGVLAQNNVILNAVVINGVDTMFNDDSPPISLLPGEDSLLTVTPSFTPSLYGSYIIDFIVNSDSADQNPLDNSVTKSFGISDSVFARDHDNPSWQLTLASYIGVTGPGYAFANFFETTGADTVTSISIMLGNRTIVGTLIQGKIYDYNDANQNGVGVEIAATGYYTIQAADTMGNFLTLPLTSALPLTGPTNYFAAIHEFGSDTAMAIAAESNAGGTVGFLYDQGDNGWYSIGAIPYIRLNLKAPPCTSTTAVLTTSLTNSSCATADGTATVNVTGGNPFTYLWTPGGQTTSTIDSLSAGIYTVVVTDVFGCQYSASVTINDTAAAPLAITNSSMVSCNGGNDGSATVTPTGGISPYAYSWSPSGGIDSTATGLLAGTYTVTVSDDSGCVSVISIDITEPSAIAATTSSTDDVNSTNNGTATVNPSGGTPGYLYMWDANTGNQTTQTAVGLSAGTYSVTVTDANNCTADFNITVDSSTTGLVELNNESSFYIYPNPNNGQFIIELNNVKRENYLVEVRNIIGQLIYSQEIAQTSFRVNLSEHNAGVYFLTVSNASGIMTEKLVVY